MPRIKPKPQNYVAYYRASTEQQRDGIGLEVQQNAVHTFIEKYGGTIIEEIQEIVSGGSLTREGFLKALKIAKENDATLLVHRIDRLSRSGFSTIFQLEEQKVPFIEADSPHDSSFSKTLKFVMAKEEKDKINRNVSNALSQIKDNIERDGHHISKAGNKITSLGNPENLSQEGRDKSILTRKKKALENTNNIRAYAIVKLMRNNTSLRQTSKFLNENGFNTSTGKTFGVTQVTNLIKLYEN